MFGLIAFQVILRQSCCRATLFFDLVIKHAWNRIDAISAFHVALLEADNDSDPDLAPDYSGQHGRKILPCPGIRTVGVSTAPVNGMHGCRSAEGIGPKQAKISFAYVDE